MRTVDDYAMAFLYTALALSLLAVVAAIIGLIIYRLGHASGFVSGVARERQRRDEEEARVARVTARIEEQLGSKANGEVIWQTELDA